MGNNDLMFVNGWFGLVDCYLEDFSLMYI